MNLFQKFLRRMVNLNRNSLFLTFHIEEGHVYEHLHPEALKFLRVLANHGSSLSFNLINRYGLNQRLRNHLVTAVK